MNPILYDISSAWPGRPEAPDDIGNRFLRTLDTLEDLEPSFRDWGSSNRAVDDFDLYMIAPLRTNIGAFVSRHVGDDEYGRPDTAEGYWVYAISGAAPSSRRGCFQVNAGSEFRNYNRFEIGSNFNPPDPSIVTFPLYKGALLAMIALWPAPWANARCSIWGEHPPTLPGEPPFPYSSHQMPWISYLDAERAAKVKLPPGVRTERTPDGGLLMIATEARFDPTNVEHMRPSRLIAEVMIEHGNDPPW